MNRLLESTTHMQWASYVWAKRGCRAKPWVNNLCFGKKAIRYLSIHSPGTL